MYSPLFSSSASGKPPLRIGVLLDTTVLPACFAEILQQISTSNFARIELLIFNQNAGQTETPQPHRSIVQKAARILKNKKLRQSLLFTLYERWDRKRIAEAPDPLAEVDCAKYFEGIDSITVKPITKRFVHRFPEEALEQVRAKNLDVLIRFGFNILRGGILQAARYGVWSYHHGDNDEYRGGPAYFWEIYEDNLVSGAILQVLTEELDAGKVLCKGLFATLRGSSWARNRVQPYWGSITFLIQKLHQLHQDGWERVESEMLPPAPYRGKTKIYTIPTNGQMLRWVGPLLARTCLRRIGQLFSGTLLAHWRLGVNPGSAPPATAEGSDLRKFHWIESPRGHFYADPFLVKHLDKPWVFFEDYDYDRRKGVISCAEVIEDGRLSKSIPALEMPYHLSYPCVFRDHGQLHMIPESVANQTVNLYHCLRFPDRWEQVKVLFEGPAVDTTVWIEDGMYWFFVTMQDQRGAGIQLWLFYSRSLTGEWIRHPRNPISTDVRLSRGGGAIYRQDGRLFRPSQDCSGNYGRRFKLNEIQVLNEREYRERPVVTVDANGMRRMIGTHTYSRLDRIEVIDGCAMLPARHLLP